MLLSQIIYYLESFFPLNTQEKWDFSGLFLKPKKDIIIKHIFYALDFNKEVFEKIKNLKNINLIITHHPFIFSKTKKVEFNYLPYKKDIYEYCYKNNIAIYALHTNYDNYFQGTSYQIAKVLGYEASIKSSIPNYPCLVELEESFENIIFNIKKTFKWKKIITNLLEDKKIHEKGKHQRIAFFAGHGDIHDIITFCNHYQIDLLITSDMKWSDKIFYNDLKLKYLIVPHAIEQVFISHIISLIKKLDKNIDNTKHIIAINERLI